MCKKKFYSCFDRINQQRKEADAAFLAELKALFAGQLTELETFTSERDSEIRAQHAELLSILKEIAKSFIEQRT